MNELFDLQSQRLFQTSIIIHEKDLNNFHKQHQNRMKHQKGLLNPDWEQARKHGIAALPGIITQEQYGVEDVCPCCMNKITKQRIQLCQNSKSMEFLGFGFPLYYIFLKYSLILLFTLIISYTSMGLLWAYQTNFHHCNQQEIESQFISHCGNWMIFLSRTQQRLTNQEIIIRGTSFLLQLFVLVYMRDIIKKTNNYYDQRQISPSDFSILIENIPKKKGLGSLFRKMLKDKQIFKKQFEIQNIIYINELHNYFNLKQNKQKLIQKLKKTLVQKSQSKYLQYYGSKIQQVKTQIDKVSQIMINQQKQQKQLIIKDQVKCQKLIIIVNSQQQKYQIITTFSKAEPSLLQPYFGKLQNKITFSQAPQPRQIKWENINYPKQVIIKCKIISWLTFFFILSVITIVFFYLISLKTSIVQQKSKQNHQKPVASLVYITLLLIILFNKFILSTISHCLTDYQKPKTSGQYQFSFAIKYLLGMFFTTAIMALLVEDLKFHNIYQQQYGLIQQQTLMYLLTGFLAPLLWIINPWYIYQQLKKMWYQGSQLLTQQQANKIMELPSYSIGKRYAQIIQNMWFTYLYSSLIPFGSFLIFIGLSLFYWIDKYNLLRKSSVLQNISSYICMYSLTLLDFTLVLKPLGQILFDLQIRQNTHVLSYICLSIGVIYLVLPINKLLNFIHDESFQLADKTYRQSKEEFPFDYHTLNPLRVQQEKIKTLNNICSKKNVLKSNKANKIYNEQNKQIKSEISSQLSKDKQEKQQESNTRVNTKYISQNAKEIIVSLKQNEPLQPSVKVKRKSNLPQAKQIRRRSVAAFMRMRI